jgi:hypothetical protein
MFLIFTDGFLKDILVLLLATVLIGSAISGALATAADAYFGDALNGLMGYSGEYDLILHVQKELKDAAAAELQKYLDARFSGGSFKEGPTIAGKSNFFISLPEKAKTRVVMEKLGAYFQDIPGNSGHTIILEPRITLRGAEGEVGDFLIREVEKLPGVEFAFRRGSSVDVVLKSADLTGRVMGQIKDFLAEYRLVEIRLPLDGEGDRPIAADMKTAFRNKDIVMSFWDSGGNDELSSFVKTLGQMRRFLAHYGTKVYIKPVAGYDLDLGERIYLQGNQGIVVELMEYRDGEYEGLVIRGDVDEVVSPVKAHKLEPGGGSGEVVGTARMANPREQLTYSLGESIRLLEELNTMVQGARDATHTMEEVMARYDENIAQLEETREALKMANKEVVSAISGISQVDLKGMSGLLWSASKGIQAILDDLDKIWGLEGQGVPDAVATKLEELLRENSHDPNSPYYQRLLLLKKNIQTLGKSKDGGSIYQVVAPIHGPLLELKINLESLALQLGGLTSLTAEGLKTKAALDSLIMVTDGIMLQMKTLDVEGVRQGLERVSGELESLASIDVSAIISEMERVRGSLPQISDEEITTSIKLLDSYMDGQVISGERMLILTHGSMTKKDAESALKSTMPGGFRWSVLVREPAVVEPDIRSSIHSVLGQVRSLVAALIGITFTVFALSVDHCQLMVVMNQVGSRSSTKGRIKIFVYGGAVGAYLLTSIFFLTGARIPLLDIGHVLVLGLFIGIISAALAERLSPVDAEEVMAGEALGLSYYDILKEIVIPAGRPGILYYLNKGRLVFKIRGGE